MSAKPHTPPSLDALPASPMGDPVTQHIVRLRVSGKTQKKICEQLKLDLPYVRAVLKFYGTL